MNVHPSATAKVALEQHLQPDLESIARNFVFDGDEARCTECANVGIVFVESEENAWIDWSNDD